VFAAWHGIIGQIFGEVPFLMSTEKRTLPFAAMFELIAGMQGYTLLTTSSIPLALFVVLPALVWVGQDVLQSAWQTRTVSYLPLATLAFLLLMTTMPDHIWGSITSIGRVITPMYPLLLWTSAQRNTRMAQFLAAAILFLGLCAGFGLASIAHPFHLA
jgi:hypothetical protein